MLARGRLLEHLGDVLELDLVVVEGVVDFDAVGGYNRKLLLLALPRPVMAELLLFAPQALDAK